MANGNQLPTPQDLVAQLNLRDQLQQRRQQLASTPVNPGLLVEGQGSIGDFFKNPTEAQRAALLQTGISLLGSMDRPNTLANIGTALQSGLGTLGQARAARRQSSLEDLDQQIKQANERFTQSRQVLSAQQAGGPPAELRVFNELTRIQADPNETPERRDAAARKLGALSRAVGTGRATEATTEGLPELIAESEALIEGSKAGAKESEKLIAQGKLKPAVEAAVAEARKVAEARGEAFTDFKRAEASLPSLRALQSQMEPILDKATFTIAGKARDVVRKELNQPTSAAAVARGRLEAAVDNQVLPLLKETFGAQFTVEEGDRLRRTLLDIDASPAVKRAQLDQFITQKVRNLQAKQQTFEGLGGEAQASPATPAAPAGDDEFAGFEVLGVGE